MDLYGPIHSHGLAVDGGFILRDPSRTSMLALPDDGTPGQLLAFRGPWRASTSEVPAALPKECTERGLTMRSFGVSASSELCPSGATPLFLNLYPLS